MDQNFITPNKVFFSYAREDSVTAAAFRDSALHVGIEVWIDTEELSPATLWESEIEHAIAQSDLFLALVTHHYLTSSPCRLEVEKANRQRKRIFPIIDSSIDEKQIPDELGRFHWFRLSPGTSLEKHLAAFVTSLKNALHEDRDRLRMCTDLTIRARRWKAASHDSSIALRGAELKRSRELIGSKVNATTKGNPLLGDEALELIAFSERRQSKSRSFVMAIFATIGLVLTTLAGLAMNASLEAETNQIQSVRSQLNQMATTGDIESLFELAAVESEIISRDALSTLQVRLASEEHLHTIGGTVSVLGAQWVTVRGSVVLIGGGQSGSAVMSTDDWKESVSLASPFEEALFDISLGGTYLAAWNGRKLAIRKIEAMKFEWQTKLLQTIEHVTVNKSGTVALVTTAAGLSILRLVNNQLEPRPLELPGCGFVTWISPALLIVDCKNSEQAGYWLVQIEPNAGSITKKVYVTPQLGNIKQVLSNNFGTVLLRTNKRIHAFQAPIRSGADGTPELGPGAISGLGQFDVANDVGLALANHSARIAMLQKSGEVQIESVAKLAHKSAAKRSSTRHRDDGGLDGHFYLQTIRAGGWENGSTLPVFDALDERVILPGETNRIVDAASGETLNHIEGESSTVLGTGDDAYIRADERLIGMSLVHGGRGEISLREYALPEAVQILNGEALAFSLSPQGHAHVLLRGGRVISTDLSSRTEITTDLGGFPVSTLAATVSRSGAQVVALTPQGNRFGWLLASPAQPAWQGHSASMSALNQYKPLSMSNAAPDEIVVVGRTRAWLLNASNGAIRCDFEREGDNMYAGMVSFFKPGLLSSSNVSFTNGTGWENRHLAIVRSTDCKVERIFRVGDTDEDERNTGFGLAIQLDSSGLGWLADRKFGSRFVLKSVETGMSIGNLSNHKGRVLTLLAREDLKLLVSSDEDGTVFIWDRESFRQIRRFKSLHCPVTTLEMTSNGRFLAAQCVSGKYAVWDLGNFGEASSKLSLMRQIASWYRSVTSTERGKH